MGHNQIRLLKFAIRYSGTWHTYGTDKGTVRAINSLVNLGFLEVNAFRQFKLKQNEGL